MVQNTKKIYHNVCPLYTYKKGEHCYSEPINQGRFVVFPQWNISSSELDWVFTLEQSSFITDDILPQLNI